MNQKNHLKVSKNSFKPVHCLKIHGNHKNNDAKITNRFSVPSNFLFTFDDLGTERS